MTGERLDLEEGKRLLSAWRDAYRTANAMGMDTPGSKPAWDAVSLRSRQATNWLHANADAVIAAAEEAEKLREALQQARSALRTVQPLHVEDGLALNNDSVIRHALSTIDAALTPPEPLSAQQETYT